MMAAEWSRTVRRLAGGALVVGAVLFAGTAHADDVAAAANAFSRAQQAALQGNYDRAAELFELADSLAPSREALRSAVSARKQAGELALAAQEAEKLKDRYPDDRKSLQLADQIIAEAQKKLARQEVTCEPSACQVLVDGSATGTQARQEHIIYLKPGQHSIVAMFGDRQTAPDVVTETAGEHARITFHEPPAPPPKPKKAGTTGAGAGQAGAGAGNHGVTPPPKSGGLSPAYFVTGAVVTAALGGVSIWSGLDVLSANKTYKKHMTETGYQDGLNRERRSNILFIATGVAGAATIVLAAFTDFGGSKTSPKEDTHAGVTPTVAASPDGASLLVRGSF